MDTLIKKHAVTMHVIYPDLEDICLTITHLSTFHKILHAQKLTHERIITQPNSQMWMINRDLELQGEESIVMDQKTNSTWRHSGLQPGKKCTTAYYVACVNANSRTIVTQECQCEDTTRRRGKQDNNIKIAYQKIRRNEYDGRIAEKMSG